MWKLAALAGVVGVGFFAVFQTQRGLQDDSPTEDGQAAVDNDDDRPRPSGAYDPPLRSTQREPKTAPLNDPFDDPQDRASSARARKAVTATLSHDKNAVVGFQGVQGDFGGFQGSGGPRFDRGAGEPGSTASAKTNTGSIDGSPRKAAAAGKANPSGSEEIEDGFRSKTAPPAKTAGTADPSTTRDNMKTASSATSKADEPKSLFGEIEPKQPTANAGNKSPQDLFGSKIEAPATGAKTGGTEEPKIDAPIPGGNPFEAGPYGPSGPQAKPQAASGPSDPVNPFGSFPRDDKSKTDPAESGGPSLSGPSTGSATAADSGKPAAKSTAPGSPFPGGAAATPDRTQSEKSAKPEPGLKQDANEPTPKVSKGNPFGDPKVTTPKPDANPFGKSAEPGPAAKTTARDGGEPPRSLYDSPTKKADAGESAKGASASGTPFPEAGKKDESSTEKVAVPGPAANTPERSDAQPRPRKDAPRPTHPAPRLMPVPTATTQESPQSMPTKTAATPMSTSTPSIPVVTDVGNKPAPQVTIHKTAPRSAVLGKPFVYDILIKNVGGSAAHNVVVQDPIPTGVRLEGTDPQAMLSGRNLVWKLGSLEAGASRKISVKVTPLRGGQIGSVATVNFLAQAAAKPAAAQPKLMFHMQGPRQAKIGEKVTFKFTLSNVGNAAAKDVWLRDIIPDGLKHPAGDDLEYKIGSIAPGKTETISLAMTVAKAGLLTNRALITANGGVRIEAKAAMNVAEPKLVVSRTGPSRRVVGKPAVYQNMVTNGSTKLVRDATLVEAVPAGMDFVSASDNGRFDAARRTVTWSLGPLAPGRSKTVTLQLMPRQAGVQNSVVQAFGTDGSRVQTASATKVVGYAALGIDVPAIDRPVNIGEQVTLRVIGRNRGTAASANVRVKVTLPEQLSLVSVRGGAKYAVAGQTVTFDAIASLPGKERTIYDLTVKAVKPGDSRVKVQIQSDEMSKPLLREEAVLVLPMSP